MASPALGMVQLHQARRGVRAGFFILLLVLVILPVLVPDSVYAFRIRDVGSASSEQSRPSCNPLLGKCADQKNSGVSSTVRLRRRFEGPGAVQPRNAKIQPLVEESDEVDDDESKPDGSLSYVKSKSADKSSGLKISENVRLQFRTSATKTSTGYSGRGSSQLKVSAASSEDEDEGEEAVENYSDEEDDEDDEDNDDVADDNEDEDDEDDVSDSQEGEDSEAEVDDTDEEEDEDETAESEDDEDHDENDDTEQEEVVNDKDVDSDDEDVKSDESAEDSLPNIELESKQAVKQDASGDKRNVKVVPARDVRSVEKIAKKSIENVQEVTKVQITKEKKENTKMGSKSAEVSRVVSSKAAVGDFKGDEEGIVDAEIKPGPTIEQSSTLNETDDEPDDDDEEKDDGRETEDEVTPPPRKLEKVRLADKSKSMEVLRARSFEVLSEKIEPPKIVKDASDAKKIETPKPTPPTVQKPEVKQSPKLPEKITPSPAPQEMKKPETKEKKAVASQPKKDAKSSSKQSEKPAAKISEVKPDQKPEKPKSKPKKQTEASITLSELNDLLLHVPSFTPNFTAIKDPLCQQHGKIFLRQLRGYKLWALQMLDSSAKIPSGLLRGNLNQLGDFDQCLGVKAHVKVDEKTVKVQGKYCLATVDLQATRQDMKIPVNLMQSRAFLRANMNEPTHFVPRFTTANWALCVPAACSAEDVQAVMEDALSVYNISMGLRFTIGVDSENCYVKQKAQSYSKETVAVLYFYAMTVCLVFVATLRDFCVTSEGPGSYSERIIMAFSLRRTTRTLFKDSPSSGDVRCIHGIRSLATIFLYMAHKLIPIARVPYANRVSLTEIANNPLSSILRVSLVYTDSFLFLSGVLTAYNMAKEFNDRGEIRWFCRFVTRFIRLTPALLAVVFWYAFVMEHLGSGPQWSSVVKSNAELCKHNAWTNFLYIQNFFPFEEMCATHTHQLALDMQLSLIAPMLVFFLYSKPIIGIIVILFLLQVSATVRYLATMNNYLSVVIFHGMTLKHLYKTANLTYALPLHRATPYLFGIGLGVLMRYTGKQFRMHKVLVITGWLSAAALGSWSLLSPWKLARRDYTYDVEEATYYAVILPVCWAISLSWIIFASFTEHGGAVNKFLSNYWMVVFSRISYSIYLTQFAVFFYNVGTTRYTSEFQVHRSIDLYEAVTVVSVSIVLTLLLDLPMQEVKNVIMECTDGLTIDEISIEEKNEEISTEATNHMMTQEPPEEEKVFLDEEVESTGWDWPNDSASSREMKAEYLADDEPPEVWQYRKDEGRRKSFVGQDVNDEEIPAWDWIKAPVRKAPRRGNEEERDLRSERRSQSRQDISRDGYVDESKTLKKVPSHQMRDEDGFRRDVRSQSRASESKRTSAKDPEELSWESMKRDDSSSRPVGTKRSSGKDFDVVPREFTRREKSLAKETDNVVVSTRKPEDQPAWEYVKRERSASQSAKDGKRSSFEGLDLQPPALRLSTRSLPRASELRKRVSSESEEEMNRKEKPKTAKSVPLEEPRISDEESWEYELRLRRQKIANSPPSAEKTGNASEEEDWSILKRRSSAEGKMALLNDSPDIENFGAWSISKVPNPGSFLHEHSESEEENAYVARRSNYRETQAPFREGYDTQSEEEISWDPSRQQSFTSVSQPTSIDEEEGPSSYDFVLKKGSKRTSLQNLSKISQEEPEAEDDSGWDFVKEENTDSGSPQTTSTGLFKRASIIKSQASEEDPEFLLPERPKLVEQEQEHPFKKAWQMQKSRSEEDGPAGFSVKEKDGKPRAIGNEGRKDAFQKEEGKRNSSSGGQNEDLSYFGGDEAESTSVSYPASNSGDSENLDWIEEDERSGASGLEETELDSTESAEKEVVQYATPKKEQKRQSEESNWEWNQEET